MNASVRADMLRSSVLDTVTRDPEAEQAVLRLLDKYAPDLVPMILGGVL